MEHAKQGAASLEASDSLAAASYYTKALIEHPSSPDYFTQRSIAFSRLKPPRHDLALRDAEYAVILGQKRQKREKIQAAQQRRVVALYGLGRYEESKKILESMLRWRPKDSKKDKMEHDMWMAKIMSRLKGKGAEGQTDDVAIKEYPEIELLEEKAMKVWLQNQLMADGTFRFDGEVDVTDESTSAAAPTGTTLVTPSKAKDDDAPQSTETQTAKAELDDASRHVEPSVTKVQPIRRDWYQDTNSVTITFYAKKVDKERLQSQFSDDMVELSFPHPEAPDQTFSFILDPTCASIDPTKCTAKATGAKVEMKLFKKAPGIKWAALDDKSRPRADKLPSAWTTKGEQDWDKKAAEITKKTATTTKQKKKEDSTASDESDVDADSDTGGDQVDSFFKKLYAGADDDTRRAMMKSFQESNGTALSTNWSEVSKGKVEEVISKDT